MTASILRVGLIATLLLVPAASAIAAAIPAGPSAANVAAPAGMHHHVRHRTRSANRSAAIQPLPAPAAAMSPASTPAPVPNEVLNAPADDSVPKTEVAPSVFALHYPPQGDGYVTGSSPQAMDDRNAARATGVEMKVPLPQ